MAYKNLLQYLPVWVQNEIKFYDNIREIRLKPEGSVIIYEDKAYITGGGKILTKEEFDLCFEKMCQNSIYRAQKDLVSGFITLSGGHRVGVCGRGIYENGIIKAMDEISSLCIRVSREVRGSADKVINHITKNNVVYNTLIISPPGCGKTTLLRDIARVLGGKGKMLRVGIADERGEIAPMKNGISFYDTGITSFVMSECKKNKAFEMMLRCMSPDVIITDEIGNDEDEDILIKTINCGVKIICSCHGYGVEDIIRKPVLKNLVDKHVFERIIVLWDKPAPGSVKEIKGDLVCV